MEAKHLQNFLNNPRIDTDRQTENREIDREKIDRKTEIDKDRQS